MRKYQQRWLASLSGSQNKLSHDLNITLLTTVAVVPQAEAWWSTPALGLVMPVTVPEIPQRITSLSQEKEIREIDDADIPPLRFWWGDRRYPQSILQ